MARTHTQKERRAFEMRRESLVRKVYEINNITSAHVVLVGISGGRTFAFEPEEGMLRRLGFTSPIDDRIAPDDIPKSSRIGRPTPSCESISSDSTCALDSGAESPIRARGAKTGGAPRLKKNFRTSRRGRSWKTSPHLREGTLKLLDVEFFAP
ncbi:Uu.00g130230.m01.CDS01 [Anthostomella pinea]|uniref:Uu.00g130230.m01.CDS01 n=1 Tax=Anthostomella pinea TaxID=933095 RepID=A0AAI8VIL9_9PEZI|nr:Uu.00g130230.m01.CDS01 [Anthostomella pinea]